MIYYDTTIKNVHEEIFNVKPNNMGKFYNTKQK